MRLVLCTLEISMQRQSSRGRLEHEIREPFPNGEMPSGSWSAGTLVEWNSKTERYRLHDLVRDYAGQRLTGEAALQSGRLFAAAFVMVGARC